MGEEAKIASVHWQLHTAQRKTAEHYKNLKKKRTNNKMHNNITVGQKPTFNGLPGAHSNSHLLSVI
jgi:hypothetical protein